MIANVIVAFEHAPAVLIVAEALVDFFGAGHIEYDRFDFFCSVNTYGGIGANVFLRTAYTFFSHCFRVIIFFAKEAQAAYGRNGFRSLIPQEV